MKAKFIWGQSSSIITLKYMLVNHRRVSINKTEEKNKERFQSSHKLVGEEKTQDLKIFAGRCNPQRN
jgi:hypothetical protein